MFYPSWHPKVGPITPSDLTVVVGEHDTTDSERDERMISEYVNHPMYSESRLPYDVTIMTLSSPLTFTNVAAPVCLPASVTPQYTGEVCAG